MNLENRIKQAIDKQSASSKLSEIIKEIAAQGTAVKPEGKDTKHPKPPKPSCKTAVSAPKPPSPPKPPTQAAKPPAPKAPAAPKTPQPQASAVQAGLDQQNIRPTPGMTQAVPQTVPQQPIQEPVQVPRQPNGWPVFPGMY